MLALTAGVAVAVSYLPQAMLSPLGRELDAPQIHAAMSASATQLGFAIGVLLLLPVGEA